MEVQDWDDKWQIIYVVEHVPEAPGETLWAEQAGHCFPKDVFEWRAAEYGFDPNDMATLLDIVLAEPFLSRQDFTPGECLYDASTIEMAREAHLRRCAEGKLRGRVSTRTAKLTAQNGLLEPILNNSLMDPIAISLKQEYVRRTRQELNKTQHKRNRLQELHEGLRGDYRG